MLAAFWKIDGATGTFRVAAASFLKTPPFIPKEVGALVPPQPSTLADTRPNRARVIQSADVFVDAKGLIYATDYNAGLYILEFKG